MKKKYFKYILAIFIALFVSINNIKAETGDVTISTNSSDFISTSIKLDAWPLSEYESQMSTFYNYIIFNASSTYGGESVAKSTCDKYCNGCQKYDSYSESGKIFYSCKIYNLKSNYFAVHSGSTPSVIREVNSTNFSKINAKYKCRYVKRLDESKVTFEGNLTRAASYVWVCESADDCKRTCSGICSTFGISQYLDSRKKLSFCNGRKLPNVFVTIDGKEVNADTLSSISDADLKDWVAKTGDGVAATLKGVLMVLEKEITCEGALGETINLIRDIFTYVKIGATLLLIVLTSIDFLGAVASGEEALKKATNKCIKRIIIVVIIYILPSLINLIIAITGIGKGLCGL